MESRAKTGDDTTSEGPPGAEGAALPERPLPFILAGGMEPVPGYVLDRRLGRGGFGEVWRAIGPGGVTVAVKFIPLGEALGEVELRSLDLMKNVHHPHLTSVSGIWRREEVLIIAMELGDRTLMDCLLDARARGLPGIPAEALHEYLREAAKGIDHLNSMHIVHRDIKPKNLLLMSGGVKVADFGVAKFLERTMATSSGAMTPSYAAPELFDGQASAQSDQYALAVSYCELRGGRLPFSGSAAQLMAGHMNGEPDLAMLPPEERPIVARALAKDPAARWPDCRSFAKALAGVATAPPDRPPGRRGRRAFLQAGVSLAGISLVATLAWLWMPGRDPLAQLREREIVREVALLKADTPTPIRDHGPNYAMVERLDPDDNSAFEILSDDRVVDLRAWKDVPAERMNEPFGAVTMTRRVRLKKTRAATTVHFQGRTSGLDVFMTCVSPYPFRELGQRAEEFTGSDRMRVRKLEIDVSSVPVGVEFDLRTISSYWNTLQTDEELWFGAIGYERSFKISQLLLFPREKPYKTYWLKVSRTRKDVPVPYDGPKILLTEPDRDWIYWEVPSPSAGHVYRLHWTW
jgi:eukaryotic-like serine/threonine-protein kinase